MPNYRFTNTQARVYVDRALVVEPNDVVDWPDGPPDDGQWEPVDGDAQAADDRVLAAWENQPLDETEPEPEALPEPAAETHEE